MRPVVDLPQPDSPTRPSVSPARTSKETSQTAWTSTHVVADELPTPNGEVLYEVLDLEQRSTRSLGSRRDGLPDIGDGQFTTLPLGRQRDR